MDTAKSSPLFFLASFIFFVGSILWIFGPNSGFIGIVCSILGVVFFALGLIKMGQEGKTKQIQTDNSKARPEQEQTDK